MPRILKNKHGIAENSHGNPKRKPGIPENMPKIPRGLRGVSLDLIFVPNRRDPGATAVSAWT